MLARISTFGLMLVLLGISAFALWSAHVTTRSAGRAIASITLSDHYTTAAAAVAAQESLERKYRLEPSEEVRTRYDKASQALLGAINDVRRDGSAADHTIADLLEHAIGPYHQAIQRMFDAVDRKDALQVLKIDNDEVDPRFDLIQETVNQAADAHHRTAQQDLADLQAQMGLMAQATPLVFGTGMVLLVLFVSVLRLTRRQLEAERKQAEHDALHDSLTGLPNRKLVEDRVAQALRAGQRTSKATALLLVDLDRFKEVNDTLGHHIGDQLLARIGPRVADSLRSADTIARLGGDEFVVLLPEVDGLNAALEVAARIRAILARPFQLDDVKLDIDASIGVVISGMHGDDAQTLLQRADVAMYMAKRQGRGVVVYDPENDEHSPERLATLGQLRRSLEHGELFLHYQPKVSLGTGDLTGVEALVRWQHPQRGLIPPIEFIPLAEYTGLIGPLTMYVMDAAMAQARVWMDAGQRIPVAVNISARNLVDEQFSQNVAELLTRHGVPASLLKVEVTESAVMLEPERAVQILNELDDLGVRIAIDDFGAGYTSLAMLKNLPVSELKIDKSFVTTIIDNPADALIVRSMINLGHSLQLTVVAEGVEDAHSARMLTDYGCDDMQGYFVCRPVLPEALITWSSQRTVVPPAADISRSAAGA
jgi:diguanylate cyclase (GGDEF)-like protein